MDKLQSFAQNTFSQGRNWCENGITAEKSRVINRAARDFDPALTEVFELLYKRAIHEQLWSKQEQHYCLIAKDSNSPSIFMMSGISSD